jgi:16S rRNA G966 N2-methylase RsmD
VRSLGLESRAELERADAVAWLRRSRGRFDLVFCDPPYRLADRLEGELNSLIPERLAEGGRLITESGTRRPLALGLPLLTERRFGDTLVRIHRAPSQ